MCGEVRALEGRGRAFRCQICLSFHEAKFNTGLSLFFFFAGLLEAVDVLVYVVTFQAVYFISHASFFYP